MINIRKSVLGFGTAIALAAFAITPAKATPVALELSLVMDTSGSVNSSEMALQPGGLEAAFRDPGIQAAIAATTGGIAVNLITFGTTAFEAIGWTHIFDAGTAESFANAIAALSLTGSGTTNIADGIATAASGIDGNTFVGDREVIDVSGDGKQNVSADGTSGLTFSDGIAVVEAARNDAEAGGKTVNGLPILTDFTDLDTYYTDHVVTSDGFVLAASGFEDFESAVATKIEAEVTGTTPVPAPGAMVLFGLGLAVLGVARRKRAI